MNCRRSFAAVTALCACVLLLSLSTPPRVQANNEPSAAQLSAELNALRNRVAQLENARGGTTGHVVTPAGDNLATRVDALDKEMATLRGAVKVSAGSVTIDAPRITLVASTEMTFSGADISDRANKSFQARAGTNMIVQSGAQLLLSGGSVAKINGPTLVLNNGSTPIATQTSVKSGTGSPTVLAP